MAPRPTILRKRCNNCGICVETCPYGVFSYESDIIIVHLPENCIDCRACQLRCPKDAISFTESVPKYESKETHKEKQAIENKESVDNYSNHTVEKNIKPTTEDNTKGDIAKEEEKPTQETENIISKILKTAGRDSLKKGKVCH